MKILIASHSFSPTIGGIETFTEMLAEEFVRQGHIVQVLTQTPNDTSVGFNYPVHRQPNHTLLMGLVKWCDIFFHSNISLKMAWPLLLIRRPWVIVHHTWIGSEDSKLNRNERLKRFVLRFATCISVSKEIADHISTPSIIIGNAYRDDVYYEIPDIPRTTEFAFLGRLVLDKGVDILIEALSILKQNGLTPQLTIIGNGPERESLERLAFDLGVDTQITFTGIQTGVQLAQLLNRHKILIVPSRWKEPFGIVALEGIACGCVVVGSVDGGLKDAIGPCGVTFPNGDDAALAIALNDLLVNHSMLEMFRKDAAEHLQKHLPSNVANLYLKIFDSARNKL